MRKIIGAVILLFAVASTARADVEINSDNFPDNNFRGYISEYLDLDKDGSLSDTEISNATEIEVEELGINSLKGIEYFTSLKKLSCGHNKALTSLNLDANVNLEVLFCTENTLKEISVSGCEKLKEFYCYINSIDQIDLTHNTELVSFDCQENCIAELDLSKNTKLVMLDCGANEITSLNLSNNTELRYLYCRDLNLNSLDVERLVNLVHLWCFNDGLNELNLSSNNKLRSIRAYGNKLKTLDLSNKEFLTELSLSDNEISDNYKLQTSLNFDVKETDGKFQVVFKDVAEFWNVKDIEAFDSSGKTITITRDSYDLATGTAEFPSSPSIVTYRYNTGLSNITLNVEMSKNNVASSSSGGCSLAEIYFWVWLPLFLPFKRKS